MINIQRKVAARPPPGGLDFITSGKAEVEKSRYVPGTKGYLGLWVSIFHHISVGGFV